MTSNIKILPDDKDALNRQHIVEREIESKLEEGYVSSDDHSPGFIIRPGSPEEVDDILAIIAEDYPDFTIIHD